MGPMNLRILEPVSAGTVVKYQAMDVARRIWHAPGRTAFRRRLKSVIPNSSGSVPRPSFGWLADPLRMDETAIGGGVKLGHLRAAYGEHRRGFNILYLVSSILHLIPHVEEMVAFAGANQIPVVWNQNGVAYPSWCGDSYPWFNCLMSKLIARADHVVYQSEFCRSSADRYLGPVGAVSEILWNPVDLEHFAPAVVPKRRDAGLQLLAMGTNHAFYRVRSSLDCLAELIRRGADARLTIAGELRWSGSASDTNGYLNAHGLKDRVQFLPRFTQAEAPSIYHSADILLHPKYKDPCPTVPIEAMACGLPVIGTISGGMPELVPSSVGQLVPVADDWLRDHAPTPQDMADAVELVASDLEARSHAARLHACASFDRERWVARHGEIFERLLSGSKGWRTS